MINAVVVTVPVDEKNHDEFVLLATKKSTRVEEVLSNGKHLASAAVLPYEAETYEVFAAWEHCFTLV